MRLLKALLVAIPVLALGLSHANETSACGGCFHEVGAQPPANIEVTGHKMIVSVSATQTTLWDQISYTGNPSSFAWVLPVKGNVTFGLSSDALFRNLEMTTEVTFNPPKVDCYGPNSCVFGGATSTGYTIGGGGGSSFPYPDSVTVIADKVVGPYEMVQLHSSDPAALTAWLTGHSFEIPDDAKPIIEAYVADGFDFLALKLVPGAPVSAMRPVRVTTPGNNPVLPLRMLAIGTGATTPVRLWVMAASRYEAVNMPDFTVTSNQITWSWITLSGNLAALEKSAFDASAGKAWHIEVGEPFSPEHMQSAIPAFAQSNPVASGYADEMGNGAFQAATDDLAALFGTLDPASLWVTRLHGELSRQALSTDLILGASADQTPVIRSLHATTIVGTTPTCAENPTCAESTGTGAGGGSSGGGGCSMTVEGGYSSMLGALSVLAALALLRRRQHR